MAPLLGGPSAFCSVAAEKGLAAGAGARAGQPGAPNPGADPGDAGAPPGGGRHQCLGRRLRASQPQASCMGSHVWSTTLAYAHITSALMGHPFVLLVGMCMQSSALHLRQDPAC